MTKAYFLQIGMRPGDDFASYLDVMVKDINGNVADEVAAMMGGNFSGWTRDVSIVKWRTQELNLHFETQIAAQLIFQIVNPGGGNGTHFTKDSALATLKIKGLGVAKVIRSTATYPKDDKEPVWASAEIDLGRTRQDIKNSHADAEGDGHMITRFPFVFNFEEHDTRVSPVIKSRHIHVEEDHDHPHDDASDDNLKTHGGIHPRDPKDAGTVTTFTHGGIHPRDVGILTHGGIHPKDPANCMCAP
jgi:hypothetical protein